MGKKVSSTIKLYPHKVKQLTDAQIRALEWTGEKLHEDVKNAQVMPFDTSHLQNTATFLDTSQSKSGTVSLVSDTPYARRLYFHPEYDFRKTNNPNAQGKWYEDWISGSKKDFCKKTFAKFFKQLGGV